jgi:hypothetical protein
LAFPREKPPRFGCISSSKQACPQRRAGRFVADRFAFVSNNTPVESLVFQDLCFSIGCHDTLRICVSIPVEFFGYSKTLAAFLPFEPTEQSLQEILEADFSELN